MDAQVAATLDAGGTLSDDEVTQMLLDARGRHRAKTSRGLVAQLDAWRSSVIRLEGSALAEALDHLDRLWPRLVMFLGDARIPLDNGHSERQVRGPVLGRLNYQGNRSDDGAWVTALFYSLTRSAINLGLRAAPPEPPGLDARGSAAGAGRARLGLAADRPPRDAPRARRGADDLPPEEHRVTGLGPGVIETSPARADSGELSRPLRLLVARVRQAEQFAVAKHQAGAAVG